MHNIQTDYTIARIDDKKPFMIGNIKIKPRYHIKNFLNREYKWCTGCERYIENKKTFWLSTEKYISSCNKCRLTHKLKIKFNINYKEYLSLIKTNECGICGKNITFVGKYKTGVIDHCHKTNRVRGILCRQCNNALGLFKDNIELLEKTIFYLKRGDTDIKYNKKIQYKIDTICPITGFNYDLVCDHNHKTGFIRGNIYNYINLGIGLFKDSIENLEKSIIYLKKVR